MTDKVISLQQIRESKRLIWVCRCGCTTHYHYENGEIECGSCGHVADSLEGAWRLKLPETPEKPEELDESNFRTLPNSTPDAFMKRQLKCGNPISAMFVLFEDGGASTWSPQISTMERVELVKKTLAECMERLIRCVDHD